MLISGAAGRVVAVVAAAILVFALTPPAYALGPCQQNNGAINGSDATGSGWGYDLGPTGDQGTWAPSNGVHDSTIREWCEPYHDWVYDDHIDWTSTRMTKLKSFGLDRRYIQEINIADEHFYNWAGQATTNFSISGVYVADIFQQAERHQEELSFLVPDVSRIQAYNEYWTRTQWDEATSHNSWSLLNVDSKSQWTDRSWNNILYDIIGRIDNKYVRQQ